MSKRCKVGFYIRVSTKERNGGSGFYFQKVSGWVRSFKDSDGFLVRIGFHRNEGLGSWHITDLETGLGCGIADTYKGAVQLVKERIDAIAKALQEPKYVRLAQELAFCLQFSEEDEHGRKFPENQPKR